MLTLREYRAEDFPRLLEIDEACFIEGIAYSARELRHFLGRSSATKIIGEIGETIKGFIIADRYRPRRSEEMLGHIIPIDVLPEARRTGLGSRLISAAEDKLRVQGCTFVVLETAVDNLPAMHFYKKHGYTGLKILPGYYLDSLDALLMGKKLQ